MLIGLFWCLFGAHENRITKAFMFAYDANRGGKTEGCFISILVWKYSLHEINQGFIDVVLTLLHAPINVCEIGDRVGGMPSS